MKVTDVRAKFFSRKGKYCYSHKWSKTFLILDHQKGKHRVVLVFWVSFVWLVVVVGGLGFFFAALIGFFGWCFVLGWWLFFLFIHGNTPPEQRPRHSLTYFHLWRFSDPKTLNLLREHWPKFNDSIKTFNLIQLWKKAGF